MSSFNLLTEDKQITQEVNVRIKMGELEHVVSELVTGVETSRDMVNNTTPEKDPDDYHFHEYRMNLFKEMIDSIQKQVNHQWVDVEDLL